MKISFVTCSNAAPPSWDGLFDGIAAQIEEGGDFEVIAVNNGIPAERSRQLVTSSCISKLGSRFRFLEETRPGIAYARATGMAAAAGEWLVLLDDDNTIAADFLVSLRKVLKQHDGLGGIIALITPIWEKPVPDWLAKFGVNCLSYTSATEMDESFVPRRVSSDEAAKLASPPGGGMIINAAVFRRYIDSPNLTERLALGRVAGNYFGCDDNDLWSEVFGLELGVLISRELRIGHQIPYRRTRLPYLCRLNYQMSFSFGYMHALRGEKSRFKSVWTHLKQAKRHVLKALRFGGFGSEFLWWVKSIGFERGYRDGFLNPRK
jgi:glycosyltransferase involved in cell wall biosynthesis